MVLKEKFIRGFNYLSRRILPDHAFLPEADPADLQLLTDVRPFTMTSPERIFALISGVRYIAGSKLPGAIVECGVWRGGSMMAAARTLLQLGCKDRHLYLFDTYAGMTQPSEKDRTAFERQDPAQKYAEAQRPDGVVEWSYASLEEVQQNMWSTGYPRELIHFVKGPVEKTIPEHAPEQIALLRLDTDFYESSLHEMEHLYPRLIKSGVLILDDYGHWEGQRTAVEEYFKKHNLHLLLTRVDYTGRVAIKI